MNGQKRRFDHTCRNCSLPGQNAAKECYSCVLRDIVQMHDVPCCGQCRAPLITGTCNTCDGRFDGKDLLVRKLEAAGLGNTDGDYHDRPWKELGAALCGYKDSRLRFLYFPLRNLFIAKLFEFLQSRDVDYDLVVFMPSSKDLLGRLAGELTGERAGKMGIAGKVRTRIVGKNGTEPEGSKKLAPSVRWNNFKERNLYYVAEPDEVPGSRILLIDDNYKSGCSMNLATMRLLESGAAFVDGFALCRWV